MILKLSSEVQQAIDESRGEPVQLEDPRTHKTYMLIERDMAQTWLDTRRALQAEWTEEKNARRCKLVRKKFSTGLTAAEDEELVQLQEAAGQFREQFGPMAAQTVLALEAELARLRRQTNGDPQ